MAIEAVFESLPVKREVFTALDRVMKPGAILATNTSTLDVNTIAEFTRRPADVLGLHFFSPANVMRLLEVVRGRATAPEVLATALALARRLRKVAVVSGVCDGFIGNRMLDAYVRQAWWLVEEGATPWQVDQAIEGVRLRHGTVPGGRPGGPRRESGDPGAAPGRAAGVSLLDAGGRAMPAGTPGQKTGGGWYDYPDGPRRPVPSPAAEALVTRHRAALGVAPRAIEDQEIVDRLVYALVNEGARLLEEGTAARPGDIDVVYIHRLWLSALAGRANVPRGADRAGSGGRPNAGVRRQHCRGSGILAAGTAPRARKLVRNFSHLFPLAFRSAAPA